MRAMKVGEAGREGLENRDRTEGPLSRAHMEEDRETGVRAEQSTLPLLLRDSDLSLRAGPSIFAGLCVCGSYFPNWVINFSRQSTRLLLFLLSAWHFAQGSVHGGLINYCLNERMDGQRVGGQTDGFSN